MQLDRVTITGADESVKPSDLTALSRQYPFVEWGILISQRTSDGPRPRFPAQHWIRNLQQQASMFDEVNLSLHVCGDYIRQLVLGENNVPWRDLLYFKRVQLNFHGELLRTQPEAFVSALDVFEDRQIIFQIDGGVGESLLAQALYTAGTLCVPLFDLSHGAGVLPSEWPKAMPYDYQGYAGGLGPDNLVDQLKAIGEAAGDKRIWIDMETKVRSDSGRAFDLELVERVLKLAQPLIPTTTGEQQQ